MKFRLVEYLNAQEFEEQSKRLQSILATTKVYRGNGNPSVAGNYRRIKFIRLQAYRPNPNSLDDFTLSFSTADNETLYVKLTDIKQVRDAINSKRPLIVIEARNTEFWEFVNNYVQGLATLKSSEEEKRNAMIQREKEESDMLLAELQAIAPTFAPKTLEEFKADYKDDYKAIYYYKEYLTDKIKAFKIKKNDAEQRRLETAYNNLLEVGVSESVIEDLTQFATISQLSELKQLARFIKLLSARKYITAQALADIKTYDELETFVQAQLKQCNADNADKVDVKQFKNSVKNPDSINLHLTPNEELQLMRLLADDATYIGGNAPLLQYSECAELLTLPGYGEDIIKFIDNVIDADSKWGISLYFSLSGDDNINAQIEELIEKIPAHISARGTKLFCSDLALKAICKYGFSLGSNPGASANV